MTPQDDRLARLMTATGLATLFVATLVLRGSWPPHRDLGVAALALILQIP